MYRKRVLLRSGSEMIGPDDLPYFITLKLRKSWLREFADVVTLIGAFDLNETFLPALPAEHHAKFLELLEEKRRDDAWHAREG
jgi:hypothetical protein